MVPPRRQGTPTRLRNWAMSSPKKPQAATTRTMPGVTRAGPSVYGPSCDRLDDQRRGGGRVQAEQAGRAQQQSAGDDRQDQRRPVSTTPS